MATKLNTATDYLNFLKKQDQGLHHTNYYHYTSIDTLNNILSGGNLWLTSFGKENSNDIIEREWYKENGKYLFSVCFSTGTSESLPLWYLYSGIDGKGARIRLKKKTMTNFYNKLSSNDVPLFLAAMSKNKKEIDPSTKIPLNQGQYEIKLQDILYVGKDSEKTDTYRIKYNGNTCNNINLSEYNTILNEYPAFLKGLIWFYEKETRLQIEITDTALQRALTDTNKTYVVLLDINSILQEISITLAPEFSDETEKQKLCEKEGFKKVLSEQLLFSDYKGTIHMSRCITQNVDNL